MAGGKRLINLVGFVFGRLTVIRLADKQGASKGAFWECVCSCGRITIVDGANLRRGYTTSCGCYGKEQRKTALKLMLTTHGLTKTPTHYSYRNMLSRCKHKSNPMYYCYGGRGITVCDRWKESITNFIEDMGLRPSIDHSIDRIDNNKGYYKENCQWILKTDNVKKQNQPRDIDTGRFINTHKK